MGGGIDDQHSYRLLGGKHIAAGSHHSSYLPAIKASVSGSTGNRLAHTHRLQIEARDTGRGTYVGGLLIDPYKGTSIASQLVEGGNLFQSVCIGHHQPASCRGVGRAVGLFRHEEKTVAIDGTILSGHAQRFSGVLPPESPIDPMAVAREEIDRTIVPAIPILVDQEDALRVIDRCQFIGFHSHGPGVVGAAAVGHLVTEQIGSTRLQAGGIHIGLDSCAVGTQLETTPHTGFGLGRRIPVVLCVGTTPAVVVVGSRSEQPRWLILGIGGIAPHHQSYGILAIQVETKSIDRITPLTTGERKEPGIGLHHLVEHGHHGSLASAPVAPGQRFGQTTVVPGYHQGYLDLSLARPIGDIRERIGPDERKHTAHPGGQKEYISFHLALFLFFKGASRSSAPGEHP